MPTYQYRCTDCGNELEVVQKFTDSALTDCPACTGQLRKVFNAVGVVFKGSGFYRTDSRADAKKSDGSGARNGTEVDRAPSTSAEKKTSDSSSSASGEKSDSKQPATAGSSSGTSGSGNGSGRGSGRGSENGAHNGSGNGGNTSGSGSRRGSSTAA